MEIVVELVLSVLGEVLFEGLFEGAGWVLRRRWGRLVFGIVLGVGGGLLWSIGLGHDGPPIVGSVLVAAQLAVVPLFGGRDVFGRTIEKAALVDIAVVGAVVVAARWVGFALGSA